MIYPGSARQLRTRKLRVSRQRGRAPVGNPVFNGEAPPAVTKTTDPGQQKTKLYYSDNNINPYDKRQ